MYSLRDDQIDYILNDIQKRGIRMESLQQDLLDHICSIIEENFGEDEDFEEFYNDTIKTFYKRDLSEIEAETILLLTFKNYYAMKKVMIISGAVSAAAFAAGSFFKIMHWPGAAFLLSMAIILISFVFLPLMFVLKIREIDARRDRLIAALGILVGILYCLSMLFLILHLPGKQLIWLSTLGISFFIFIPVYFFTGIRKAETRINTIVSSILLVAATGIQFTLTSLGAEPSLKAGSYPQLKESKEIQYQPGNIGKQDTQSHETEK